MTEKALFNRHLFCSMLAAVALVLLSSCGGGSGGAGVPLESGGPGGPGKAPPPMEPAIVLKLGTASGYGSLDGQGRAAFFDGATGIDVDPAGTAYVVDWRNYTLRKITPDGTVSTLAGKPGERGTQDGGPGVGRLENPQRVAVMPDGAYVTDNFRLRKVAADGTLVTVPLPQVTRTVTQSDGQSSAVTGPLAAYDVAAGRDGLLYLLSSGEVWRRTAQGAFERMAQGDFNRFNTGAFNFVNGMAADAAGNVYLSKGDHQVLKVTAAGQVTTLAGTFGGYAHVDGQGSAARFLNPGAMDIDDEGNLWIVEDDGTLRKVTPSGQVTTPFGQIRLPLPQPNIRPRLAFGPAGQLYFTADRGVERVSKVGELTEVAGHVVLEGTPLEGGARLVGADSSGNFTVVGFDHRVRKYPADGGAPQELSVDFKVSGVNPMSVPIEPVGMDSAGNIYFSRIQLQAILFDYTIVGGSIVQVSPSGISTDTSLPIDRAKGIDTSSMTVAPDGTVYFVDTISNQLFRWTAATGPVAQVPVSEAGTVSALTVNNRGQVYLWQGGAIQRVENGALVAIAGAIDQFGYVDGPGSQARFSQSGKIVADAAGNVYVADGEVIRKISPAGAVSTVAGTKGAVGLRPGPLPGSLGRIRSLSLGGDGKLYAVADNAVVTIRLP